MAPPAVGVGTLRRLMALETDSLVLSVYLDLHPAAVAACKAELAGLAVGLRSREGEADIGRVRDMLRSMPAYAYATRGSPRSRSLTGLRSG